MNITNRKIVILGGKRSGQALARLVTRLGGKAGISEMGSDEHLSDEFRAWAFENGIASEYGGHTEGFVTDGDLLVLSPGVRLDAPPVEWARAKGIPILGEIEFAAQFCGKPIIAVTGSNGKTTVSTLIRNIIDHSGNKACLCGNIGAPFSDYVLDLDGVDTVVLEISSFQLESLLGPGAPLRAQDGPLHIEGFRPHVAVVLNFSQNHLDRHKDLEEYLAAKKRIFLNQGPDDFAVLNRADAVVSGLAGDCAAQVVYFDVPAVRTSGMNPNFAAVIAVGRVLGIEEASCHRVFSEFQGVEHRLERVRNIDGIDFINDSKATTVEAARWALANIDRPVVMICGGRDKNVDFGVLSGEVAAKVKKMYAIGEARPKIRKAFAELVNFEECEQLDEAVLKARQSASQGDCVLLSPMCASFDMFADYEHRGRVFKEIVQRLE